MKTQAHFSADEMRVELTRLYGSEIAEAIMKRANLATNMNILDSSQAHHLIPIEILKEQGIMKELLKMGWNFNDKINGEALAVGFHGTHPNYTGYVRREIAAWISANGAATVDVFQQYVEGTLLTSLRKHIQAALVQFATTKENLDSYFAKL